LRKNTDFSWKDYTLHGNVGRADGWIDKIYDPSSISCGTAYETDLLLNECGELGAGDWNAVQDWICAMMRGEEPEPFGNIDIEEKWRKIHDPSIKSRDRWFIEKLDAMLGKIKCPDDNFANVSVILSGGALIHGTLAEDWETEIKKRLPNSNVWNRAYTNPG
jgi:hypothetical protein